mgnify:CR=1 FL=1
MRDTYKRNESVVGNLSMNPQNIGLELMDYIGWDVAAGVGQLIYPTLCDDKQPSPMAVKMLQAGNLGIKTGKGLKDYSGKTREELNAQRTLNVLKISKTTKEILANK